VPIVCKRRNCLAEPVFNVCRTVESAANSQRHHYSTVEPINVIMTTIIIKQNNGLKSTFLFLTPVTQVHLFYYCTHGCVCQLDITENDEWMNEWKSNFLPAENDSAEVWHISPWQACIKLVATGMQAWCGKVVAYATCLSQMHQFTTAHCEKNWPDAKCMHVSIFKKRQLSFLLNNHFVSGIAFLSFYAK